MELETLHKLYCVAAPFVVGLFVLRLALRHRYIFALGLRRCSELAPKYEREIASGLGISLGLCGIPIIVLPLAHPEILVIANVLIAFAGLIWVDHESKECANLGRFTKHPHDIVSKAVAHAAIAIYVMAPRTALALSEFEQVRQRHGECRMAHLAAIILWYRTHDTPMPPSPSFAPGREVPYRARADFGLKKTSDHTLAGVKGVPAARAALGELVERGSPVACIGLALELLGSPLPEEAAEGVALLERVQQMPWTDPSAARFLARLYFTGEGVERDHARGVDLLWKATLAGDKKAASFMTIAISHPDFPADERDPLIKAMASQFASMPAKLLLRWGLPPVLWLWWHRANSRIWGKTLDE